jgi:tetratricopeptide (TPR) repeat protein
VLKVRSPKGYAKALNALAELAGELKALESEPSGVDRERVSRVRRRVDDLRFEVERYELLVAGELEAALGSLEVTLDRLPEALVAVRVASKLTIADLARALNIQQTVLARYEATNYQGVSLKRANQILEACGATLRCKLVIKGKPDRATSSDRNPVEAIQRCLELGKPTAALRLINNVERVASDDARADLLAHKVRALFLRGELHNALQAAQEFLAVCERLGTDQRLATALNTLGVMEKSSGLVNDSRRHYDRAISHARKAGDNRTLAMACANLAALLMDTGQPEKAEPLFLEALGLQKQLGDQKGEASSLTNLAILFRSKDPGASIKHYERAAELHEQAGNNYGLCVTLTNLASVETELGRIEAARKHFARGGKLAEKIDSREQRGIALAGTARLAHLTGDLEEAHQKYVDALLLMKGTAEPRVEAMARANCAGLLFALGRKAESRKEYARALAIFHEAQDAANEEFYAKELLALEAGEQRYFGINPATLGADLRQAAIKALHKNQPNAYRKLKQQHPELIRIMGG